MSSFFVDLQEKLHNVSKYQSWNGFDFFSSYWREKYPHCSFQQISEIYRLWEEVSRLWHAVIHQPISSNDSGSNRNNIKGMNMESMALLGSFEGSEREVSSGFLLGAGRNKNSNEIVSNVEFPSGKSDATRRENGDGPTMNYDQLGNNTGNNTKYHMKNNGNTTSNHSSSGGNSGANWEQECKISI